MEDEVLNRVAVEQVLAMITDPERRMIIQLSYWLEQPEDWTEAWPPTYASIGRYIGQRFRNEALSEAAIRYIRDSTIASLRGEKPSTRRRKRQ